MKRFLGWGATLVALAALSFIGVRAASYVNARTSTAGTLDFGQGLAIPPLLAPRVQDGRTAFDLRLESGTAQLLPGKPAETWGVNGPYFGPTLRASRGDTVVVRGGPSARLWTLSPEWSSQRDSCDWRRAMTSGTDTVKLIATRLNVRVAFHTAASATSSVATSRSGCGPFSRYPSRTERRI